MDAIFSIIQVLIAIAMIAIILIQRGPGAAAGSGFGAGASGTVFGARGSGSFLTRSTALLAIGFFAVSMTMAVLASRAASKLTGPDLGIMGEVIDDGAPPQVPELEVPAVDLPGVDDAPSMQSEDIAPQIMAPALEGSESAVPEGETAAGEDSSKETPQP